MARFLAPENDYRPLAERDPGPPRLTVTVVIPVFNRVALLRRTLAGLAAQQGYPDELIDVVVVDDGSEEDVAAAVAASPGGERIRVMHQDHEGYGAGRARNLGASSSDADVVLFLDADCIPDRGLVAAHMAWHHRSNDLVVVGSRHHVDSTDLDPAALAREGDIGTLVLGEHPDDRAYLPEDWRRDLYRLTTRLTHGTEGYRTVISSNVSMWRHRFAAAGRFSEDFTRWGGEDTELGWRLGADGRYVVPEDRAAIYHQGQEDRPGRWRSTDRQANDELLRGKIPHRFYRLDLGVVHEVPKVSWVIAPAAGPRSAELLTQLDDQQVADWEALFPLDAVAGRRVAALPDAAGDDARRFLRAIAATRGQYVAVLSGAAAPDPLLLDRAVRLLDRTPRASLATVAAHTTDAAAADTAWGPWGMPAFTLTRRREWAKVLPDAADPAEAWSRVRDLCWAVHLDDRLITLPDPAATTPITVAPAAPATPSRSEAMRGWGRVSRRIYRWARGLLRRRAKPVVLHLGDPRSLDAVRAALPWASVVEEAVIPAAIVVGGGARLDEALRERVKRHDTPRLERVIVGATAPDPVWRDLAATAAAVGVATAEDAAVLTEWGVPATVVGHPADDPAAAAPIFRALEEAKA
jgi:glycosyltransferase involved in cell wall biosynthesis